MQIQSYTRSHRNMQKKAKNLELEKVYMETMRVLYDCETTGFSIYDDYITDMAAKVTASPVPLVL